MDKLLPVLLTFCDVTLVMGNPYVYSSSGEGSGELYVIRRELICYQCSGSKCPADHYSSPLRHLHTHCQYCYKEWDVDRRGVRVCMRDDVIHGLSVSNETSSDFCGLVERGDHVFFYCVCSSDYCNQAWRPTLSQVVVMAIAMIAWHSAKYGADDACGVE